MAAVVAAAAHELVGVFRQKERVYEGEGDPKFGARVLRLSVVEHGVDELLDGCHGALTPPVTSAASIESRSAL